MTVLENVISWVIMICITVGVAVGVVYGAVMLVALVQEVWRPLLGLHPPHDKTLRNIERLERQLYGSNNSTQQGEEK